MKVTKLNPGSYYCNCYVIGEEGEPCVIVDPGCNNNGMLDKYIDKHHAGKLLGIFITHGHFDHIGGLATLAHKTTLFIHSDDVPFLSDGDLNLSNEFVDGGVNFDLTGFSIYELEDEDEINIGGHLFQVIHTPFHTVGSICLYIKEEKTLFSGDTLFHLGVGRSDLPGAAPRMMPSSLAKLKKIPGDTKVYPGHDASTTMENEFKYNSYLK